MLDSISVAARELVSRYDHNQNGAIDLVRPPEQSAEAFQPETVRLTHQADHQIQHTTKLFFAADTNRDNRATVEEVETLMRSYDTDQNGQIDVGTWGKGSWDRTGLKVTVGTALVFGAAMTFPHWSNPGKALVIGAASTVGAGLFGLATCLPSAHYLAGERDRFDGNFRETSQSIPLPARANPAPYERPIATQAQQQVLVQQAQQNQSVEIHLNINDRR